MFFLTGDRSSSRHGFPERGEHRSGNRHRPGVQLEVGALHSRLHSVHHDRRNAADEDHERIYEQIQFGARRSRKGSVFDDVPWRC